VIAVKPSTMVNTLTPRNMLDEFKPGKAKALKVPADAVKSVLAKKHAKVIKTVTKKE
jgi:hypothetical protein